MTRRIPIVATLVVAAAVAILLQLGFWQLQRAAAKQALVDNYAAAEKLPPIAWPSVRAPNAALPLFRRATGECVSPGKTRATAGENRSEEAGYVQIVACVGRAGVPAMTVELGWARDPNAQFSWPGGPVSGVIVPDRQTGMRLIADQAPSGLEPSRVPSVASVSPITPAIHKGYAATWFAFALIAPLIYLLALRRRWADK